MKRREFLLNELLGLEVSAQVKDLPRGQPEQATHRKDAEVHHSRVCRF